MTSGQKIKYWRQIAALTVRELAERTHLSHTTIYNLERDRTQPRLDRLKKIASALHVSVEQLEGDS